MKTKNNERQSKSKNTTTKTEAREALSSLQKAKREEGRRVVVSLYFDDKREERSVQKNSLLRVFFFV